MSRALIFDFDGLLVETEHIVFEVWVEVLAARGVHKTEEDFLPFIGTNDPERDEEVMREWLGADADIEAFDRDIRALLDPRALEAPVLEGAIELLDAARDADWKVGLGSSSGRRWIESHLSHRGLLEHFDAVVTREDAEHAKPAPDIYLEVARRLGVPPARCVVLEDSEPGCRAAVAAGMTVIACPSELTRTSDFSMATRLVASLLEVTLSDL
jgi:HAD superfamily hydrolase (TIGR01509 family)